MAMRALARAAVVFGTLSIAATAPGQSGPAQNAGATQKLYRVSVSSAVINPVRNKASFWDNFGTLVPDAQQWAKASNAAELVNTIASVVQKSKDPHAVAAAIGVKAALFFGEVWSLKKVLPDPRGQLLLNGKPVINLRKIDDTAGPTWPDAWSAGLALSPNSVLTLKLNDADVPTDELIGSCTWQNLKLGDKTVALSATNCTQPALLSAVMLVQPGGDAVVGEPLAAGDYTLDNVEVEVAETKANGLPWDAVGDPPDPQITIKVDGVKWFTCDKNKNQYNATCNPDKALTIGATTKIELSVLDIDLAAHDKVGDASVTLPGTNHKIGAPIQMKTTGQLNKATLVLRRAQQ
jgi:hypothetical protein